MFRASYLCLCLAFAALAGCQRQVPVVPVTGRVTLDSQPIADVELQFHRMGPEPPHTATPVMSDAAGQFTTVNPSMRGLLAGEYVVVFSKWVMPDGSPVPPHAKPGEVGAKQLIPERYQSMEQRVHTVTVSPAEHRFDFALQSK